MQRRLLTMMLLFCIVAIAGTSRITANDTLHFELLKTSSLLPTNEIRNLYQDSEGYIWISTYNGLVRFDGYTNIVYQAEDESTGKAIDGFVNVVIEDQNKKLWIGTHNGLYCLDKQTEHIKRILSPGLQVNNVETIICTRDGCVWAGTNKGLFYLTPGEKDFKPLTQVEGLDIKALLEDKRGHLWIGTWERGLYRYVPENDSLYVYPGINEKNSAHVIFQDSNQQIWVGTWRYGLLKINQPYDMEHYSFTRFLHRKEDPKSIADDIIYTITQDRNTGKLWIGSRSGLSVLDEKKGSFTNYLPGSASGSLPFSEVDALLCSRDGIMWIGMLGGGIRIADTRIRQFPHDKLPAVRKHFPITSVKSICPAEDEWLWMGIMGFGLIKYNNQTNEVLTLNNIPGFSLQPNVSTINEIIPLQRNGLYGFATEEDGIWLYNGKEIKTINQQTHPNLSDNCIYSLLEDKKGNLWIGSRSGVYMYSTTGELYSLDELAPGTRKAYPKVSIFKLQEDKSGNIWAATPTSGIWKITCYNQKFQVTQYNSELGNATTIGAMTLCTDRNGNLWAGTNGDGVCLYDSVQNCFRNIFKNYIDNHTVIYNIQEDTQGDLWFTTNSEMYHVGNKEQTSPTIHIYTIEDGLQDYIFNRNACCKTSDGKLYFGGVYGLNGFYPNKISYNPISHPVEITDLRIFNTSIRDIPVKDAQAITDRSPGYAHHITLDYHQNNFSICFSALNFINPMLCRYKYRLDGYDTQWITTDGYTHDATYNNLPAGTYTFQVRGANANGVWSDEARELTVTILPPPWLTPWAYCLYAIAFLLIIGIIFRTMQKRIILLQTVRLSQLERQKSEEINHAKLQFFTNITHELLTPLTIISASVEELKHHHPEMSNSMSGIEENLSRLIRLIQQILEFRKVENGKQKLKVSKGNLTSFLQSSVQAFIPLTRKKHLQLLFEQGGQEYSGYFDSDKLDKITYNLLSNAAKYTPEGGTITLKQQYDATDEVFTFTINNPGDVISPEKIKHMFERFYEGEYRKFHTIGTGIGLSLTKDLVVLHHGEISVRSNADEGITFTVVLPVSYTAYTEEELGEETWVLEDELQTLPEEIPPSSNNENNIETKAIPTVAEAHKKHVLLVEDNDKLREILAKLLSDYFIVTSVSCGELALDELAKGNTDLVISDIMMPGIQGLELCQLIKSKFETKHIPVILLTAKTSDQDRIEGYEVGADGYICKPLRFPVLLAKIDNLLKRQETVKGDSRRQLVFEAGQVNFTPQDEVFLKEAVDCVNRHLSDMTFDVNAFIEEMGMARTTLSDKLKELTDMTPLAFISSIRLQAAFRILKEQKKIRISDLAYAVGFNDPKYFSQCFRKKFGFSPKEYQMQNDK